MLSVVLLKRYTCEKSEAFLNRSSMKTNDTEQFEHLEELHFLKVEFSKARGERVLQ